MFYNFKKNLIWVLLILTIFVSIPCIIISAVQIDKDDYLSYLKKKNVDSFISRVTIGTLIKIMEKDLSKTYLGDLVMAFNMAGIFYVLAHSIYIRRLLKNQ